MHFNDLKENKFCKFKNEFGITVVAIKVGNDKIKKCDNSIWYTGQFHTVTKCNVLDYILFYVKGLVVLIGKTLGSQLGIIGSNPIQSTR